MCRWVDQVLGRSILSEHLCDSTLPYWAGQHLTSGPLIIWRSRILGICLSHYRPKKNEYCSHDLFDDEWVWQCGMILNEYDRVTWFIWHEMSMISLIWYVLFSMSLWLCGKYNNNNSWTDMRWVTWLTEMNRHDMIYVDDRDKQMAWFAWLTEINGHNMINMIDSDDKWT